ncbi:hypothetical protein WUBG_09423, partial [Wuchereria bancrofti]
MTTECILFYPYFSLSGFIISAHYFINQISGIEQMHRPSDITRTDVWPKPRETVAEDRFLNLIDSDDYTRVREFNIDEKGTVVSRGDSFRLKSPSCHKRELRKADRSGLSNESNSSHSISECISHSVHIQYLSDECIIPASNNEKDENNQPSTSTAFYE